MAKGVSHANVLGKVVSQGRNSKRWVDWCAPDGQQGESRVNRWEQRWGWSLGLKQVWGKHVTGNGGF